jgi:ATP-dependent helicase/nuclease subunit A
MTRAAYTRDGHDVSREDFYAIACDPQRSVVVEACAGAGKTWMLVSRILRALLAGAQPHEILAITFTRKAAGEMRARLAEWLAEYAGPACDAAHRIEGLRQRGLSEAEARTLEPTLATLHEQVLRAGRPVEIRTFHAWFSQLLRAAPLELLAELGLQPEMDLIEDVTEHEDEVYRRFHAAVLADAALLADYEQVVLTRGRSQLRAWLDAAWSRRVEVELADARIERAFSRGAVACLRGPRSPGPAAAGGARHGHVAGHGHRTRALDRRRAPQTGRLARASARTDR